jgi:hypothetical protein
MHCINWQREPIVRKPQADPRPKDKSMFVVLITVVALVARGFDWVRETALSR